MSTKKPIITRRNFLQLSTQGLFGLIGLLGLGGLIRFLSFEPDPPPPKKFEIGPASNYPPESRTVLPEIPAIIISKKSGFTILSLVCPHLGCTVEAKPTGFACPCHGSRFDKDGTVTKGPANNSLKSLNLEQTADGNLVVYKE